MKMAFPTHRPKPDRYGAPASHRGMNKPDAKAIDTGNVRTVWQLSYRLSSSPGAMRGMKAPGLVDY